MKLRSLLTTGVLCFLRADAVFAQPISIGASQSEQVSMTLGQAQKIAISRNRDVVRASIEVNKSEALLRSVKTTRYPSLLAIAFVGQPVTNPTGTSFVGIPGAFEPLTQQYRISMQVQQASLAVQIAQQAFRLAKQTAVAEVKKTFLRMVALVSAISSREENLLFLKTLESYVEADIKRGASLKVDGLITQARVARAEYELERDRDDLITAQENLNRLLDRPIRAAIAVREETQEATAEMASEPVMRAALAQRPEIFQNRFAVKRSSLQAKIETSRYIPDISFGATGIFSRNLDITFPRSYFSFGFLGIWEPWDWGRRLELSKAALKDKRQLQIALSDLSDKVSVQADDARRKLKVVEMEVKAAVLAQQSAAEELRIVHKRYKVGAAVLKDVAEAQAAFSESITENVKAKTDYAAAQVDYDLATGKDFD